MASDTSAALNKVGPKGGPGGENKDMDTTGVTRISKIGIRHGGAIDGFIVHFERNGSEESTDLWGSNGGELTEISFEENEYIMTVSGHAGTFNTYTILKSLKVETNLHKYGPYGAEDGEPFEFSAQGGEIIGFFGRSGQFLDAIGVYVKTYARLGPIGGDGGQTREMDPSDVSRIVKVGIRHGGAIDGFIVHYERNGQEESTDLWGAEGGELSEISFEENETITALKGYAGIFNNFTILKSLKLETNLHTYGPYGAEDGEESFEFSVQGGQIIGFHARSGQFVDAIGVYVKGGIAIAKVTKLISSAAIGVCYGMIGNNLPSHSDVIKLYQSRGIGSMRIYDPDHDTLNSLRGSKIQLIMDASNVAELANGSNAADWVRNNILPYSDVSFKYIAVGNEVMDGNKYNVLPAMSKIYDAISSAGLQGKIMVSTAVRFDVLTNTYPPSAAVFSTDHMGPIVQFLKNTGAPLLANVYPYFSHAGNPHDVSLDFALFRLPNPAYNDGQYRYQNIFDAMVDSMYYALEKAGGSNVGLVISESGWPSAGGLNTTVENARTYNQNLINHVKNGTPKRPGKLETYIFAMFNENLKTGAETEKYFGLFNPDQRPVYPINFS